MSTAEAPLTPRRAGRAIAAGAPRVAVELAVDPPSLGPAKAVKGGDAGLKHVVAGLNTRASDAPRLELAFAGGRARPHHVRMLADGVSRGDQAPVCVALDFSDTDVLHYDIAGYPPKWPLLFANPSLRVVGLDVSGCSVEDAPPPRLFLEALGACEHLESLGLRHMGSGLEKTDDREEFADTVAWLVRKLPKLASLDVTHCDAGELKLVERLGGGDGAAAAEAPLPSLKVLRLAWNGLQSAAFLRSFPDLHTLHLGRNDLGAAGAEALAAYARGNPQLRVLELNDCELGPAGCCALLEALREGAQGLRHLGLHGNDGGDAAAEAAAKLLAARRGSLERLDLSSNGCTNAGLAPLAAAIAAGDGDGVPPALTELNLSDNSFEVGTAVLRIAAARPSLDVNYYESLPADVRKALAAQQQTAGADAAAAAADAAALGPVAVDGVLLTSLAQAAAAALPQALRQLCEVRPAVAAALADGTLASADSAVAGAIAAVRAGGGGAEAAAGLEEKRTRKTRAGPRTLRVGVRSTAGDVAAACGAAVSGTVRLVCEEAMMDRLCLLAAAAQLRLVSLDTSTRAGAAARVSLSAVVGLA